MQFLNFSSLRPILVYAVNTILISYTAVYPVSKCRNPLLDKIFQDYNKPAIMENLLFASFITLSVMFLSAVCMLVVRRLFGHTVLALHNDVAGFIFNVIGVVYAVLLAFVVIVEWELFRDAKEKVHEEVRCMSDVFRDARIFGEPYTSTIRKDILDYSDSVINEEWRLMGKGEISSTARVRMRKIFSDVTSINPRNDYEKIWYQEIIARMNNFSDARNARLFSRNNGIPEMMWNVLIIGGFITIAFSFLFGTSNVWAQILMVSSLSGMIVLVMILIKSLDHPFEGLISVGPDDFIEQVKFFMSYYSSSSQ